MQQPSGPILPTRTMADSTFAETDRSEEYLRTPPLG